MIGSAAEIEDAAARWLLRQEEAGWSQADGAALEAWLNAAPQHRVAYYRLEHGWRRADRVADLADRAEPAGPARTASADTPLAGG